MNWEDNDQEGRVPIWSSKIDPDGIPNKGMLWRLNNDGSIQNRATGLVLEMNTTMIGQKLGSRTPCTVVCAPRKTGMKAQQWTHSENKEIINQLNGQLLTVQGGKKKDRAPVWCNFRAPLIGTTQAQRWTFKFYESEPKEPTNVNEAFRRLLDPLGTSI